MSKDKLNVQYVEAPAAKTVVYPDGLQRTTSESRVAINSPGEGGGTVQNTTALFAAIVDKVGANGPAAATFLAGRGQTAQRMSAILNTGEFSVTAPSYANIRGEVDELENKAGNLKPAYTVAKKPGGGYTISCIANGKAPLYSISDKEAQMIFAASLRDVVELTSMSQDNPQISATQVRSALKSLEGVKVSFDGDQTTIGALMKTPSVKPCVDGAYKR